MGFSKSFARNAQVTPSLEALIHAIEDDLDDKFTLEDVAGETDFEFSVSSEVDGRCMSGQIDVEISCNGFTRNITAYFGDGSHRPGAEARTPTIDIGAAEIPVRITDSIIAQRTFNMPVPRDTTDFDFDMVRTNVATAIHGFVLALAEHRPPQAGSDFEPYLG